MTARRWRVFGTWPWPTLREEWVECLCGRKKQFWGYDREWRCRCGRIYRATRIVELQIDDSQLHDAEGRETRCA